MVRAIVGGNWGDEGKGKITDHFAGESDIVVRFQGGANAGHTIINEYGKFALHLLPSGVFRKNAVNIIAQGVALNLDSLFAELDMLTEKGVPAPRLYISDRAQIILPYHKLFDELEETRLGAKSFGSTKQGIAAFYSDKYLKVGVRVSDIFYPEYLREYIKDKVTLKNISLEHVYGHEPKIDPEELTEHLLSYAERLRPMVIDTAELLSNAVKEGKEILLEGQLGSMRDPDNGIYPFTTSSSPLAGFATVGAAGIPPYSIEKIYTVVKAYSSAVGAGAFITELFGDEGQELRDRGGDGGEYGATTGRPRRVGWFDAVASHYGCVLQGTTDVVFSLIDVLGYLDKIPVCVAYEYEGKRIESFPPTPALDKCTPVYEYLEGWKCDIKGCRSWDDLPEAAKAYIAFAEEKIGYPITVISTGPKRDDIIFR